MNCKNIAKIALSVLLASGGALVTPVYAENETSNTTQLNYEVSEAYEWMAPADFSFTQNSNGSEAHTATVKVIKNVIGANKTLKISIASGQVFELADANNPSNKRSYTVKDGANDLSAGSEVLAVEAGTDTGSKNLNVQLDSVATEVAGSYAGTLKFVSAIESTGTGAGSEGGSSTPVIDGTNITLSNDADGNGKVDKGDTLTFATSYLYSGSNTGPTEFLVLNTSGSDVELFAKTNLKTNVFSSSNNTYENSALDFLLNTTYYNSLSDTVKGKIKSKSITQNTWSWQSGNTGDVDSWYKSGFTESDTTGTVYSVSKTATGSVLNRNVYALDVEDVVTYLGGNVNPQDLNKMFFGTRSATVSSNSNIIWLRSANSGDTSSAFYVNGSYGYLGNNYHGDTYGVRPAFTISLN